MKSHPALIAALALAPCLTFAADVSGDEALRLVDKQTLPFTAPARRIPSALMVDGPLLGNGDLGVTVAGAPEALRFYIGKNDFWGQKTQSPQTVGSIELRTPAIAGAPYSAACDMRRATWQGSFAKDDSGLRVRAFVDANANRLMLSLANTGKKSVTSEVLVFKGGASGEHGAVPAQVADIKDSALAGCEQVGGGRRWFFQGEMADLKIEPRALSNDDILALSKAPRGGTIAYDGKIATPMTTPAITNALTISGSIKVGETGEANYLLSKGEWSRAYSLGLSSGCLRFAVNGVFVQTDAPIPKGKWVHFAAAYDGRSMRIVLDGKLSKSIGGESDVADFLHAPDGDKEGVRKAAFSMRIAGEKGNQITLAPGASAIVTACVLSDLDSRDPLAEVKAQVSGMTAQKAEKITREHEAWWAAFWKKSFIEIPDKTLERHWYASQYTMASCSRAGKIAPGLWGNWITMDKTAWHGDYHLNYNFQSPFFCLDAANHAEATLPFYEAMMQSVPRGQKIAAARGWKGIHLPVSIGPWGTCPEGDDSDWGQRSNTAYAATNFIRYWQLTQDKEWLKKTGYPYLREVEKFWTDYLKFDGTRYVIEHDAIHEGSGGAGRSGISSDFNPILSLGLVRSLYACMLETSEALGVDAELRPKWRDILAKFSEFPTQEKNGKTVFRYTEKGTAWWGDNTLGIQHIFPAGAIGLDSDPKLLQISRDTIDAMNRWNDNNGSSNWYTACIRVGYDPEKTLKGLRNMYDRHAMPNGIPNFGGGGVENASPTLAITEMLMQSHEGVIRLFPCWPMSQDARFGTLRARGAFLISAELKQGVISNVEIVAEKGGELTLQNPWLGKNVTVIRNGKSAGAVSGERLKLKTASGERIGFKSA